MLRRELSDRPERDPFRTADEMKLDRAESFEHLLAQVIGCELNGGRHDPELVRGLHEILRARSEAAADAAADLIATFERDQACASLSEALLFRKGLQALCTYRAARAARAEGSEWFSRALWHRTTTVFGVDIHPGARIAGGVVLDHGTGVVIGETTVIESGCYLFHAVTLGSTGTERGKRHPTIRRGAFLGAGATVLGRVEVGEETVVAAGSVVVSSVPARRLVGGAPAKDLGEAPTLLPPRGKSAS
ncbi:MAG: serine O-acetyltransferase EpsC [Gemmatimonadota bacterium]